jgi:hypothetical protein
MRVGNTKNTYKYVRRVKLIQARGMVPENGLRPSVLYQVSVTLRALCAPLPSLSNCRPNTKSPLALVSAYIKDKLGEDAIMEGRMPLNLLSSKFLNALKRGEGKENR